MKIFRLIWRIFCLLVIGLLYLIGFFSPTFKKKVIDKWKEDRIEMIRKLYDAAELIKSGHKLEGERDIAIVIAQYGEKKALPVLKQIIQKRLI